MALSRSMAFTRASGAMTPKGWAFPGSLKAMGMASACQKGSSFNRGAWRSSCASPSRAPSAAKQPKDKNYLFDALTAAMHRRRQLRWHLIVIIGQPGDTTKDATVAWPEGREQVDVGTLTLDKVDADENSAATDLNFDPL